MNSQKVKWGFILLFFIGMSVILANIFLTATSVATAPGRVIQKTLETDNIIQSYEWFYDVNASYQARLNQIKQFKRLYASEDNQREKTNLRIELAAMQQTCRDLATKYNANSEKVNKSIFKGWSLPSFISIQNCE
jgi:hypothetical protein